MSNQPQTTGDGGGGPKRKRVRARVQRNDPAKQPPGNGQDGAEDTEWWGKNEPQSLLADGASTRGRQRRRVRQPVGGGGVAQGGEEASGRGRGRRRVRGRGRGGARGEEQRGPTDEEQAQSLLAVDGDVPENDDEDIDSVPLVNLDAPSPLVWVIGVAILITTVFICETIQVGGYADMSSNPGWGPDRTTLLMLGAKYSPLILAGEWWRFFTATFLQNGLLLFAATLVLLFFTRNVEREAGWWRAVFTFMVPSTFGYIVSALFVPTLMSCGTIGGVAGFVGMLCSDLSAKWTMVERRYLYLAGLLAMVVGVIIIGLTPFADNFAHMSALLMGFLLGFLFSPNLTYGDRERVVRSILSALAFPISSTLFMLLLVLFYRMNRVGEWCHWCRSITCVDFNNWCSE